MFFNGSRFLTEGFFTHLSHVLPCENQKNAQQLSRHETTTAILQQSKKLEVLA